MTKELIAKLREFDSDYDMHYLAAAADALEEAERKLAAARDALSAMLTHMGMDEDEWNKPTFDKAREHTPPPLAQWLVELAAKCKTHNA